MRRKHIWVWIVGLALVVCSLSACSLFGRKQSETAQNQTTQEAVSALTDGQKTSAGATVSPKQDSQAEQSTSGQTVNSEKQDNPSSVAEPAADVELPEIEIPITDDNNRNDERDSGHESAAPEPSGTDKPEFKGHQLVLSGQIGVKFGMNLSMLSEDEKADSYMEFTINGRTTQVNTDDAAIADDERYIYTCFVTSIQMAEPITAVFHYNEDTVQQIYSVKDYIDYLDENASEYSEAAVSLVHAIADYGHYAQPFLSATNNWTIGTDYAEMSRFFASAYDLNTVKGIVSSYQMALTKGDSKVDTAYMRLTLDSETALSVRLTVTDDTELSATATFHGNTYQAVKQSDGSYIIKVTNIPAAWLGDTVTITGTAGGEFTVTVSALSYVYSVLNSETMSAEAKNAVASMYYYYTNTVAYKAESNQ